MTEVPILRSLEELRALQKVWMRAGDVVGVVPTMGALHAGHLSLVAAAKARCDRVVVTIFVNPRQFNSPEDFARYPRTEEADAALLAPHGVDAVFVPPVSAVYPEGFATTVTVAGLTEPLEGRFRPGHFDGMTTIVTKLFTMTRADLAFFGEKDWQQLQVVTRLATDLNLGIEVVPCATVREADGLAMSSRNARLAPGERAQAAAMSRVLFAAAARIGAGDVPATVLAEAGADLARAGFGRIEYLELVDAGSLGPLRPGMAARLLVAAWLGDVRLIDNVAVAQPG